MLRRKRLDDGTFGPLEPIFPERIDETVLLLLEAVAGQQEQIEEMKADIEQLKGGSE